jgi:hypothetical protein
VWRLGGCCATSRSATRRRIATFSTLEEAQAALDAVLSDEPGWAGRIRVVELEFEVAEN